MHMLYDSESFVVVHLQADLYAAQNQRETSATPILGIALQNVQPVPEPQSERPEHRLARNGFEIVDKRSGKEVYLDGSWAELFQQQITAWQVKTPTQDEVEETLECYAQLAQNPVVMH
jgi:Protein of unknown function (DUF3567)